MERLSLISPNASPSCVTHTLPRSELVSTARMRIAAYYTERFDVPVRRCENRFLFLCHPAIIAMAMSYTPQSESLTSTRKQTGFFAFLALTILVATLPY